MDKENISPEQNLEILRKCLAYNFLTKKYRKDENVIKKFDLNNIMEKDPFTVLTSPKKLLSETNVIKDDFIKIDKIIVITGAGLSSEAGLPMGWETAKKLIDKLVKDEVVSREYINHRIESIRLSNNQKKPDFETVIEALSETKLTEDVVKQELSNLFELRNHPLLGYEILAHWLKHQVIDGIINFNFDELLDEAIEEEFVHDEYIRVIGGGDYANERLDKKGESYTRPIYIKPHGTISDPDSLRATRDHYVRATSSFQSVLKKLLKGNILFLSIGYNMGSIELNQLIQEQMFNNELNATFYVIKNSKLSIKEFPMINKSTFVIPPSKISNTTNYGSPFLKKLNNSLSNYLIEHSKWENSDDGIYPLKDLLRHEITCNLFSDLDHLKNEKGNYKIHVYNYLRTLIDFAISVAKSGALVNIFALNNGRFGRQYKKYYLTSDIKFTLIEICTNLGLERLSYTSELWTIIRINKQDVQIKNNEIDRAYWKQNYWPIYDNAIKGLEKKIEEHIEKHIRPIIEKSKNKDKIAQIDLLEKFLIKYRNLDFGKKLLKYAQGSNYEIGHPFTNGISLIYKKRIYRKLYSWHQVQYEFLNLFNQIILNGNDEDEYEILYATSYGRYLNRKWLKETLNKVKKKKLKSYLLLNDLPESHYHISKMEEKYKKHIDIKYLNWWTNNRNLLIFLKKTPKDEIMIPQAAIYFYRGNTTRRVSPISISILNDKKDNLTSEEQKTLKIKKHHLKVYEDIFKVYSIKAKSKMENNAKSFTSFITDEELELPDFR